MVRDLIFNVREGPKVRCLGLEIEGNESLPETGHLFWKGGLRKLAKVQTGGKSLFNWLGRVYDQDELEADLVAMRQVYRDRGWLDAKVEIQDLVFNEKRNRVKVKVLVDEGPLYTVNSVRIEAKRDQGGELESVPLTFPEEELQALLKLQPGVPLERARIQRDGGELGLYYGDRGYLAPRPSPIRKAARVSVSSSPNCTTCPTDISSTWSTGSWRAARNARGRSPSAATATPATGCCAAKSACFPASSCPSASWRPPAGAW
ncbi:MAG: POTRA domain-containing protein [Planctomycetota bacterium]